jgi:RNA polymerase-binding transcription factor DksA
LAKKAARKNTNNKAPRRARATRTARKSGAKPKRRPAKPAVRKPASPAAPRRAPAPAAAQPTAAVVRNRPPRAVRRPANRVVFHAPDSLPSAGDDGQVLAPQDPGLTPEEIQQFRTLLLEKRAEILGDVTTLHTEALAKDRREASGDLSSMPIHMADLGTDNYELEFTLGLIEGERVILREIDEALERIRSGTYGVCAATGRSIGKARLRAKPWAKYSYEYTLAQEQGRARRV